MKQFDWDNEKNIKLKIERGISFEDVLVCLSNDCLLDIVLHPNINKYPNQKMFVINLDDYAYIVPFVETNDTIFLKTVIPSRKATKKYLRREI